MDNPQEIEIDKDMASSQQSESPENVETLKDLLFFSQIIEIK